MSPNPKANRRVLSHATRRKALTSPASTRALRSRSRSPPHHERVSPPESFSEQKNAAIKYSPCPSVFGLRLLCSGLGKETCFSASLKMKEETGFDHGVRFEGFCFFSSRFELTIAMQLGVPDGLNRLASQIPHC